MTIPDFIDKIIMLYHGPVPFSVTSWIRSSKRNAKVGGNPKSRHLVGLGLDIVLDDLEDKPKLIAAISDLGLSALDEGDHIHIQPRRTS